MDKKAQKKKDRERRVREQLHMIRMAKAKKDKKQRAWEEKVERETNPNGMKRRPFRRDAAAPTEEQAAEERAKAAEVRAKLEKNLQVLRALEDEWKKEQMLKAQTNRQLEDEGARDIKEKMDLLQKKMLMEHDGAVLNFDATVDPHDLSGRAGTPGITCGPPPQ
jgi:hypothetical protein